MTTYKYTDSTNTVVHVIDDDGISRSSCLASILPEGAVIEPYVEPPAPIPTVVPMRQARLALLQSNLLSTVNAAIAAGSEADQITWEYATEVDRNSPLVANMALALNLTEQDLDNLFTLAATL